MVSGKTKQFTVTYHLLTVSTDISLHLTLAVLEDRFHGTLPVQVPSDAGGACVLTVWRPPALP